MKVYVIAWNEVKGNKNLLDDGDFMNEAERQQNVYSLEDFQEHFNSCFMDISSITHSIRFINTVS